MDNTEKERLKELAGIDGDEIEVVFEASTTVRPKEGPLYDVTVWKKLGRDKTTFESSVNFSSFALRQEFFPREEVPVDPEERHKWEAKKVKELTKLVTPLTKKFVSDLQRTLKKARG